MLMRTMTAVACVALLVGCGVARRNDPFDASGWKNADLTTRARADMVHDLLRKYPLEGRSEDAVLELLGAPTPTDKWRSSEMIYVLGPDPGMGIDHEWLLIELDAGKVVESHSIVQD